MVPFSGISEHLGPLTRLRQDEMTTMTKDGGGGGGEGEGGKSMPRARAREGFLSSENN